MKDWIKKHAVSEVECIVPDMSAQLSRDWYRALERLSEFPAIT